MMKKEKIDSQQLKEGCQYTPKITLTKNIPIS